MTSESREEGNPRPGEGTFRTIFDPRAGTVRCRFDGSFQEVSARFCELIGYSREELLGRKFQDITHPDDIHLTKGLPEKLASGEVTTYSVVKRYIRKDGRTVWAKAFGSRVGAGNGAAGCVEVVVEDITEQRRVEEELRRQVEFDQVVATLLTRFTKCPANQVEDAIRDGLRVAAESCDSDHALIFLGGANREVCLATEWCAPHVGEWIPRYQTIPREDFRWSASKTMQREVVSARAEDLPPEAGVERAFLAEEGARAILQVPLEGRMGEREGVIGCIVLHRHRSADCWPASDVTRVRIIGNAIAAMLERAQAETELLESEEKFGLVFRNDPEAIVISAVKDQKIADVNPRFCSLTGYSREEAIGRTTGELDLFADPEDRLRLWSEALSHREIPDVDIKVRDKEGGEHSGILSSVVATVRGREYLISMFRDLTQRRQAQEALRVQAGFDSLMTGMLSEFLRCRADGLERAVGNAMGAIAGFFDADHVLLYEIRPDTEAWRIAREWRRGDVLPVLSADRKPRIWNAEQLSSDGDIFFDGSKTATADGRPATCCAEGATALLSVPIKGDAGVVTARIGIHRHGAGEGWGPEDASRLRMAGSAIAGAIERKRTEESLRESEARFRDVADSAPMVTWTTGSDKKTLFFSKQAVELTSRPMKELIGDGWLEFLHPEDKDRYIRTFNTAADEWKEFTAEARFRRADGEYRWILVTGVPRIIDGAYYGHIGTGVDITDLRRNFEQDLAAQKRESLGVLAAGVAHDFNNLLGAIVARAEAAQMEFETDHEAAEDIAQIRLTALRAAEIVSQLMTFARQESAPASDVDLSQVVKEMLDLLRISVSKAAALKTDLSADLPPIRANAAEIRQVVMNLILNASEALGGRPGVILVKTWLSGENVILEVADTGCGIPLDVQSRIFDPFYSTRFAGRGLGLSAVQGIVRRHGGTIQVESTPGLGSRFSIGFPSGIPAQKV